jgi:hypothetical protein
VGFADLKNNLVGSISNAASLLGIGGGLKYPTSLARVTNVIDENDRSWKKSLGYSFKVVRVDDKGVMSTGSVGDAGLASGGFGGFVDSLTGGGSGDSWQEFVLQINPQELTQDEIFAIEVTPTFSGVFVEHQGITLKDIRIAGTTGLSPNRTGTSGSYPTSGRPVAGAGRSGYAEFHELRNYIRTYVEAKRNDVGKGSGELRLVWTNFRDHESLFVEPQKFTMKRSKSKPFLYDYDIQLKAIGIADFRPKSGGFFELLDSILEGIGDIITTGTKLIQGSSDFIERVESEVTSTIINPALAIRDALRAQQQFGRRATASIQRLNRLSVQRLRQKIVDTSDNANDFLGRDTDVYNEAKGRIKTQGTTSSISREATPEEMKALNGLKTLRSALDHIIKEKALFRDAVSDGTATVNQAYASSRLQKLLSELKDEQQVLLKEQATAKQRADTARVASTTAALQALAEEAASFTSKPIGFKAIKLSKQATTKTIDGNDTIQMIAGRYLGDVDRWKDIAILNNLVDPYIDQSGTTPAGKGVLRPGDIVFIPRAGGGEIPGSVSEGFDAPVTKNLTAAEKKLGVDLKINEDFDLVVSNIGDFELSSATENVAQALTLKLLYSSGDLKRHPEIGTDLQVGGKSPNIQLIANQIRSSMSTDPRVSSVIYVEVIQESNVLRLNIILSLVGLQQPVPLQIEV